MKVVTSFIFITFCRFLPRNFANGVLTVVYMWEWRVTVTTKWIENETQSLSECWAIYWRNQYIEDTIVTITPGNACTSVILCQEKIIFSLTKDPRKCKDLRMCARKGNRKKQHWCRYIEASLFIKLKCERTS